MRYRKGCISLNAVEDGHLLRDVMLARYVSHDQLREFAAIRAFRYPRSTFNWRVARLVDHGFLNRHDTSMVPSGIVYSLGRPGEQYLAGRGECFTEPSEAQTEFDPVTTSDMLHSLEINELHLRMHRAGVLVHWKWETEIRSQNELTKVRYAKDYDAIVTVRAAENEMQFALEYERMAKAHSRYARIRKTIERERSVNCLVYVVPHYDLLSYIAQHFAHTRKRVCFCLFDDLYHDVLNARAFNPAGTHAGTLGHVLLLPVC